MEKLHNSILPTPLHKLKILSHKLRVNIYCKRDDLTGFAFGGNKTRKLDYLIAEAKVKKFNTIVTTGGFQSNFCRITAAYAAKEGFETHLVLGGEKKPEKATANLLLMKMFGANIHYIETESWDLWEEKAQELANKLEKKGKKVFRMPIGGSNAIGILGYVECFKEIMTFERKHNIKFGTIIHASGSAGTQAGLILGKKKYNWKGKIIGISVAKDNAELYKDVLKLVNEGMINLKLKSSEPEIIIDDNYIGKGYGAYTKQSKEAIKIFALTEGILLDSVYTAKAAAALIDYCKKGYFNKNENILFIHTGGNIHMFK